MLLPLLLAGARPLWRWLAALVGIVMAVETLPPYPQIIGAWSTPGWSVPFWWGVGAVVGILVLTLWTLHRRVRPWLMLAWTLFTGIPAAVTFYRLLPALSDLYNTPLHPGWGFWSCMIGFLLLIALALAQGLLALQKRKGEKMGQEGGSSLEKARLVKIHHETWLMRKANVSVWPWRSAREEEEGKEEAATQQIVLVVNVTTKSRLKASHRRIAFPKSWKVFPSRSRQLDILEHKIVSFPCTRKRRHNGTYSSQSGAPGLQPGAPQLFGRQNVVACGLGYKIRGTEQTQELSLIVSVVRKLPKEELSSKDLVPQTLDGLPTDVVETGYIRAQGSIPRPQRPAMPGISLGHIRLPPEHLGCWYSAVTRPSFSATTTSWPTPTTPRPVILFCSRASGRWHGCRSDRDAGGVRPLDFGNSRAVPDCATVAELLNTLAGLIVPAIAFRQFSKA